MDHLTFSTALGTCFLGWGGKGVRALRFLGGKAGSEQPSATAPVWIFEAARKITDHLSGRPADLDSIPLDPAVLTPFQIRLAAVLRASRPGEDLTYGDVALRMGSPGAARAVGHAVKTNPILLLIPCHRVVAADGEGGFSAFPSLDLKVRLRALESPPHTGTHGTAPSR